MQALDLQKLYEKATDAFHKGSVGHAHKLFQQLVEFGHPEADAGVKKVLDMKLRRSWRKGEHQQMLELATCEDGSALACARLQGHESLLDFAKTGTSLDHLRAGLATMKPALESAKKMRKTPEMKELAELWIAILKGDPQRALARLATSKEALSVQQRLAYAVAKALSGDRAGALKDVSALRSVAVKRFPHLAALLGWTSDHSHSHLQTDLAQIVHGGSGEALNRVYKQKEYAPWIAWSHMHLGDALLREGQGELAIQAWLVAGGLNQDLIINCAKRVFWFGSQYIGSECAEEAFEQLYDGLAQRDANSARTFLELMILESNHPIVGSVRLAAPNGVDVSALSWTQLARSKKVPIELKLNALAREAVAGGDLFFPSSTHPDFFKKLCPVLEKHYGHKETYWRLKLGLFDKNHQQADLRRCCFALLKLNPRLKDELVPRYHRCVSVDRKAYKAIREEVEALLTLLPNNFQLLSILPLLRNTPYKISELAERLSEGERLVFTLAVESAQGAGRSWPKLLKTLPSPKLCELHPVAGNYILYELAGHLGIKEVRDKYRKYFCKLIQDAESALRIFESLEKDFVPLSFRASPYLLLWCELRPKDWQAWKELGTQALERGNVDDACSHLAMALDLLPDAHPEQDRLQRLLADAQRLDDEVDDRPILDFGGFDDFKRNLLEILEQGF